jgi:hypothetical protein
VLGGEGRVEGSLASQPSIPLFIDRYLAAFPQTGETTRVLPGAPAIEII